MFLHEGFWKLVPSIPWALVLDASSEILQCIACPIPDEGPCLTPNPKKQGPKPEANTSKFEPWNKTNTLDKRHLRPVLCFAWTSDCSVLVGLHVIFKSLWGSWRVHMRAVLHQIAFFASTFLYMFLVSKV